MAVARGLACALLPCHTGRAGAGVSVPAVWMVPGKHRRTRDQKPTRALLAVLKIGGISARLDSVTFSPFMTVRRCGTHDTVGLRCVFQGALPFRGLPAQLWRGMGFYRVGFFCLGFPVWFPSFFSATAYSDVFKALFPLVNTDTE